MTELKTSIPKWSPDALCRCGEPAVFHSIGVWVLRSGAVCERHAHSVREALALFGFEGAWAATVASCEILPFDVFLADAE